jgi:hypothetical protein
MVAYLSRYVKEFFRNGITYGLFSADRNQMKRVFQYSSGKLYVNMGDISDCRLCKKNASIAGVETKNTHVAWLIKKREMMSSDFITIGILGENLGDDITTFSLHISQVVLVY